MASYSHPYIALGVNILPRILIIHCHDPSDGKMLGHEILRKHSLFLYIPATMQKDHIVRLRPDGSLSVSSRHKLYHRLITATELGAPHDPAFPCSYCQS